MQSLANQPEAVLLYRERPNVDPATMLGALNEALADLGVELAPTDRSGAEAAIYTHPWLHLHLTVNGVALPRQVAAAALDAPTAGMGPHDHEAAFEAHRRTLTISLGDGPAPGAARSGRPLASDLAVMVLYRALRVAMQADRPLAVLWEQSDMIFTPEEIEATDPHHFPAALAIRPEPILPAPGAGGGPGLRALRSELFCGRQLFVRPGAMPFATARQLVQHLLERHVARATAIAEGVVLPFEEDRQLRILRDHDTRWCPTGGFEIRPEPRGTEAEAPAPGDPAATPAPVDRSRFPAAMLRDTSRSRALRTWVICLALAAIMPLAAGALLVWNLLRGPNLAVSAVACALVLAGFVGLSLIGLGTGSEFAQATLAAMRKPF